MAQNALARSRINSEVKEQATMVLEAMGLSVSDVMRIVLTRIAKERALPFELKLIHKTAEDLSPQIGI